jgi:hypothetical protein
LTAKDSALDTDVQSLATKDAGLDTDVSSLTAKDSSFDVDISSLASAKMSDWETSAPSVSNSPGTPGDLVYSSTHMYICVAENSWRRVIITEWT